MLIGWRKTVSKCELKLKHEIILKIRKLKKKIKYQNRVVQFTTKVNLILKICS